MAIKNLQQIDFFLNGQVEFVAIGYNYNSKQASISGVFRLAAALNDAL